MRTPTHCPNPRHALKHIRRLVRCPRIPKPTQKEVEKYHTEYMAALKELYDAHKAEFGYADRELEFW